MQKYADNTLSKNPIYLAGRKLIMAASGRSGGIGRRDGFKIPKTRFFTYQQVSLSPNL